MSNGLTRISHSRFTPLSFILSLLYTSSLHCRLSINGSSTPTISVFAQLPQIFIMTAGEIMLSVTALEFSYVEATPELKSTVSSLQL